MMKKAILIVFVCLLMNTIVFAQSKKELKKEQEQKEYQEMTVDDKKKKISVKFNATTKNDIFNFNLSFFRGGNTLINLNSNFRSVIKYDGKTGEISVKK